MKTMYGNIPKKLCRGVKINTAKDLKKFIKKIPDDVPIGFDKIHEISIFNAPGAPCIILYDIGEEDIDGPF